MSEASNWQATEQTSGKNLGLSRQTEWQLANARYLGEALNWLRLRLLTHIDPSQVSPTALSQATEAMTIAAAVDPPPALILLSQQLGLSLFEQSILLLGIGIELDPRIPGLCAAAQDNLSATHGSRPYPTFALALSCFEDASWDALSPERPLRYWRLIEIHQPATQPLTTSAFRADERITHFVKGLNYPDDRLTSLLVPLQTIRQGGELPPSQQAAVESIVHLLQPSWGTLPVIQLVGTDSLSKQQVAQQVAMDLGLYLYRLPIALLPAGDVDTLARLWQRESLLLPIALYLDAHDSDASLIAGPGSLLHRFLSRSASWCFLSLSEPQPIEQSYPIEIARPR
ncbi:hypothetical protein [Leptolyngbya ohadii]|uniref:hypothetical protein n=1 Tax=Leptolyngbya ohadii TaxID=1962290 RepID=UPI000B59C0AD|nr:hypothetical protein [Leptolyngbya ohadii]